MTPIGPRETLTLPQIHHVLNKLIVDSLYVITILTNIYFYDRDNGAEIFSNIKAGGWYAWHRECYCGSFFSF